MDEQQYREAYQSVNDRRCVFEKTINSRRCSCEKSCRFHLADREGIACKSAAANALCGELLNHMRSNARFALHLTSADGPLPHAREIKVQTGGLLGLQGLLHPEKSAADSIRKCHRPDRPGHQQIRASRSLPYDIIVQAIVASKAVKNVRATVISKQHSTASTYPWTSNPTVHPGHTNKAPATGRRYRNTTWQLPETWIQR